MKTINHEVYCGQDLTTLLLKAGFDWKDYFVAHSIDEHFHWEIPLHIAQRWLREVKGIEVYAHVFYDSRDMSDELIVYVYEVNHITEHIEDYISSYDIYHTYEEAQEAGIKKVLELILEKGE